MPSLPLLGFLILLLGTIFLALVWAILRFLSRMRRLQTTPVRKSPKSETLPVRVQSDERASGVLIVQSGGRIEYINAVAREWFDLAEGEFPNLENLAARIRPSDEFLKLCITEHQSRFSLNGRPVECASYRVPGPIPSLLIAMNRLEVSLGLATAEGSSSALKVLSDFNAAISVHTELQPTIGAILENVEHLVPADVLEIKLWDDEQPR